MSEVDLGRSSLHLSAHVDPIHPASLSPGLGGGRLPIPWTFLRGLARGVLAGPGGKRFPKAPKSPKGKPPQEPPRGPNAPKTKVPSIGGRVGGWFGRALGTIGRFEVIASAVGDANAGLTAARSGKTVEALGDAGSAAVKGGSLLAAEAAGGLVGGMVGGPVGAVAGVAAGVAVVEGGFAAAGKIRDVAAHAQSEHLSLSQIWTKYLDAKARNERTHQTPAPAQTYAPSAEIHRRPGIELP